MVDFEWYRSFCTIYKYQSISEAAKTRMMTQPAMSQHLAALEAEVGETLFIRSTRKITPTERGKELYSQLAPLIESLENTTMSFKSASLPTLSVIKLGAAHEFFSEKILPLLPEVNTCTISHFGNAEQLLELLKEDKLDILIMSKRFQTPGIEYLNLMDEEFVIVAPSDYEILEFDTLKLEEQWLSKQKWISYGLELPIIRRIWREHFKKRPEIRPIHIIPNLHMILKAVELGEGMSVIPTYLLQNSLKEGKSKVVFKHLKVKNELYIAYQLKNKHLPLIHEIISVLREKKMD